jgi:aryl-alcohol dehydrogenase-like predicted oxidoreductase
MKKRRIGSLEVSVIGLGCNNFGTGFFGTDTDAAGAKRIIDAALDAGINFLDTAEEYSTKTKFGDGQSEQFIGQALKGKRNQVVIASKFGIESMDAPDERGARRIMSAVEGSLKRLGTDRIDLYQQHFPDPETPIDEILEALHRLKKDGKVVEIGCSNFSGEMIDEAQAASKAGGTSPFVSAQNQYNLLDDPWQAGTIDAVKRHGLMLLPFFPLASGLLTGKYRKGETHPAGTRFGGDTFVAGVLRDGQLNDARIDKVEKLAADAKEHGPSIVELAFSWLVSQPFVASVIAGATKPEQITANAAAANWELTAEDFKAVDAIRG